MHTRITYAHVFFYLRPLPPLLSRYWAHARLFWVSFRRSILSVASYTSPASIIINHHPPTHLFSPSLPVIATILPVAPSHPPPPSFARPVSLLLLLHSLPSSLCLYVQGVLCSLFAE